VVAWVDAEVTVKVRDLVDVDVRVGGSTGAGELTALSRLNALQSRCRHLSPNTDSMAVGIE
jgi:hypothetical protein